MKIIVLLALLVALIAVPLALRPGDAAARQGRPLIIITPHNEQICYEFGRGFDQWHREHYGEAADVIWTWPGGTSEIRRMLVAQWEVALKAGRAPGGAADLVFGGGTYEHEMLKRGVSVEVGAETRTASISAPADMSAAEAAQLYGENRIGDLPVYDPDRHWLGTAVSGFGIVYNRDALQRLGLPEPRSWEDLCHPELRGWVALVHPGQSGSVATAFDAILQQRGWTDGWRILRRAAANARYFSASSLKPPMDVSCADAAVGVCIDFYGRYQAQALKVSGSPQRIGYIDPPGETLIDPDPISLLANAPHPELANRFIRYCLSPAGQALWQFRVDDAAGDGLGPRQYELRRLPVLRSFYAAYAARLIDQVDPYAIARPVERPDPNFRAFIAPIFAAMAVDSHEQLRAAWSAIVEHPAYPGGPLVGAEDVADPQLAAMLRRFDRLPDVPAPGGRMLGLGDPAALAEIRGGWLREGWADRELWSPQERGADALRRLLVDEFRRAYRRIADGVEDGAVLADQRDRRRGDAQTQGERS